MTNWKKDLATNRQQKVLHFFKIPFTADITKGLAARYITEIFANPEDRERWNKYVLLTNDDGGDSPDLKPFDPAELDRFVLPPDWERILYGKFEARAASLFAAASPFEEPEPSVTFAGKHFCFTGKFEFGTRKACQAAIEQLGGISDADVHDGTDYLVIGKLGSAAFAKQGYGRKIEWAIVARSEYGSPAILSEDHWIKSVRGCPPASGGDTVSA